MFENETQNYYEVLDVKADASPTEIRQAYVRAKAAYNKDSVAIYSLFDEQQTRSVLDTIEQAYHILSSPEKRREYDRVHGILEKSKFFANETPGVPSSGVSSKSFSFLDAADPTHQIAQNVFTGRSFEEHDADNPLDSAPSSSAYAGAVSNEKSQTSPASTENHEKLFDKSFDKPFSDANSVFGSSSFQVRENKLGLVRRTDLAKSYTVDDVFEKSIAEEVDFRGDFFKKVREYKNISLDELCDFTKISKSYLTAVENEDFANLPAAAYIRGFVAQISKALKISTEKSAGAYMANYKKVTGK